MATVVSVADDGKRVIVTTPPNAAGSVSVTMNIGGGALLTLPQMFQYGTVNAGGQTPLPAPTLSGGTVNPGGGSRPTAPPSGSTPVVSPPRR